MEEWQFEFEYLSTRHYIKDQLGRPDLPDLNAILFLIGLQELGRWKTDLSKEEKQDLMHVAVCRLLSIQGVYEFKGRDQDGWPHWEQKEPIPSSGVKEQERLLKELVILYFRGLQKEHETLTKKHTDEEE